MYVAMARSKAEEQVKQIGSLSTDLAETNNIM